MLLVVINYHYYMLFHLCIMVVVFNIVCLPVNVINGIVIYTVVMKTCPSNLGLVICMVATGT